MSPRLYPFTLFPEDRDVLGTPHRLNTKARAAFPTFFDSSAATHLAYVNDNPPGSGDIVRYAPLPPIPSGTPADPFCLTRSSRLASPGHYHLPATEIRRARRRH